MRPLRIYIATSLSQAHRHRILKKQIEDAGHILTYDWSIHGSVMAKNDETKRIVAENEAAGVMEADITIAILPGGRGTHTEIGIALGAGKDVILIGHMESDGYECIFYHHTNVLRLHSIPINDDADFFQAINDSTVKDPCNNEEITLMELLAEATLYFDLKYGSDDAE